MTMPPEEKKPPVKPLVPPPPEQQEYFPGFKLESVQLARGRYQAQKRLSVASRELEKVKQLGIRHPISGIPGFRPPEGFFAPAQGGLVSDEEFQRMLQQSRAELELATQEYTKVSWRQQVLQSLPIILLDRQSGIRSMDELISAFPNEYIDDSDQQWLQGIWNKAQGLRPPELPPEFTGTPGEARTKLLETILQQPKLELRGVHHLTVDELLRSFQPRAPELPKGMTTEDVRSILKDLQFDEETQKQIEDIHELAEDLVNDWKTQVAYMDLLRSGIEQAEAPELTPLEFLKMTFTQPSLASLELLEKFWNMLPRPLAALAIMAFPRIRKDSDAAELETLYNQYRDLGEGWWGAASQAYQDWDTNIWLKMAIEIPFDPTSYIGLGILTKITKPLPYIGKFSAGLERGWIELWDLPFRGARSILKKIPKTPGQHALSYARQAFLDSRAFLRRTTGRNVDSLSKSEIVDSFKLAINQAADMPHETGNWAVRTGRYLIDHDFFKDAQVKDMLTAAGVKKVDITKQLVMDFNYNWDRFFYKAQTAKEAAADILAHAGVEPRVIKPTFAPTGRVVVPAVTRPPTLADLPMPNQLFLRKQTVEAMTKAFRERNPAVMNRPIAVRRTPEGFSIIEGHHRVSAAKAAGVEPPIVVLTEKQVEGLSAPEVEALAKKLYVKPIPEVIPTPPTAPRVDILSDLATQLEKQRTKVLDGATDILRGDTAKEVLDSVFRNVEDLQLRKIASPVYDYVLKSGRATSWITRTTDKIIRNNLITWFDRQVTAPMANQYLLFTNYGPFNVAENVMRSFLGAGEVFYPRAASPIDEVIRIGEGLSNLPYDFIQHQGRLGRLEIAVTDPRTGKTLVFSKGKIPFVTKRGPLGVSIRIGNKDYPIRSWQDWNDMFGDIGTQQRAWYFLTKYKQLLWKEAPDEMAQIAKVFDDTDSLLAGIESFSKREKADLKRVLEQDATVGPDMIRKHDVPVLEVERRRAAYEINKVMDKATDIYSIHKKTIRDEVLSGKMFKEGIDNRVSAVADSIREFNIASLTHEADMFDNLVRDLAEFVPENSDELLRTMGFISDLTEATGERISDVRQITRARAQKLSPKETEDFYKGSNEVLGEFIGKSGESVDEILRSIRRSVERGPRFTTGYRTGAMRPTTGLTATEGEGLYVARTRSVAEFWGEPTDVKFLEPRNPLVVKEEPLYVLQEVEGIFSPITPDDSVWARINKQAAKDVGATDQNWGAKVPSINKRISELAQQEGHDAISITSGGDSWDVLIDRSLYTDLPKEGPILKPEQLSTMDNLSQAIRTRHANTLSTRELDRRIINEMMEQTPRNQRDKAFWEHLETRRSNEAWEPYWTREADLFEAVEDIKNRLMVDLGVTPDTVNVVPEVVDKLTPAHVAYMLGVTGDDLNKGLTKVGAMVTIRPKRQFITWIYSKAKKTASRVGKTPDDIGFSRDAIGDVYDQMFTNLGFDPKMIADEPLTPTMSQLEEVRQELHKIEGVSKIPENDYVKYKGYVNKLADGLEQLPSYRKAVMPEGVTDNTNVKALVGSRLWRTFGTDIRTFADKRLVVLGDTGIDNLMAHLNTERLAATADSVVKIDEVMAKLRQYQAAKKVVPGAVEDWFAKKESAMMSTRTQFEMDFTDYSNANSVDAAMRMIFPFWQYEWQRWFWLPRQFLKTPGIATGVGRYMDTSDQGYIPVPNTDIQFNPLRGTVFMGGFRRLYLRDFPEYYDAFPGMEIIDYISRIGFYPGIHVMAPIILFGALNNKPEFGELAPAWIKTPLNAARAIAPEQAGKIIDIIFPDRFRSYYTMLTLAEQGYDADEIWRKKQPGGVGASKEEEKLWLRAEAKATGFKGILFEQTGLFRLRPQEYTQIQKDFKELIAELTGVSVEVQETIQRRYPVTGKRFSDYYKLDSLQQKIIYEQEAYRRWQGVTTPLYPSTWQQEDVRVRDYYERVEQLYDDARHTGIFDEQGNLVQPAITELTRQWVFKEIGPDQWVSGRGEVLDHASAASMEMGKRDYPDVPKTLEQRTARFKERGIPAPTQSPDQELLYLYYEIKPEYGWDWDRDRYAYDFDIYFAKIDALLESMQGEFRQRFEDRIQFDWTPMEKLYWQISREYLRPYRLIRNVVLEQYTPEQQELIRRYEVARGAERDEIRATPGPEGRKLISHFTSTLREARQRYRLLDPTTDAWAYFFGTTDTLLTTQSKETYKQIEKQYLTPMMIR